MIKFTIKLTKQTSNNAPYVTGASCLSAGIPVVGPFISVGLGMADALWGEQFYNWIEKEF